MKLLFSILFSSLVFFSGTKNLIFLVDYNVNADYYEAVCENQNTPEMDCHGKCQVTKDAQKNSDSLNFNHFIFNFYPQDNSGFSIPQTEFFPEFNIVAQHALSAWNPITLGVPNPPPNI